MGCLPSCKKGRLFIKNALNKGGKLHDEETEHYMGWSL